MAGIHTIRAVYGGDDNFKSDSTAMTQTVNKAGTTVQLLSGLNPSLSGQSVMFTATVSVTAPGSGPASGTVAFRDGATSLGTGTLDGSGVATYTTAALGTGIHLMTAVYGGDTNRATSTSAVLSDTVNPSSYVITAQNGLNGVIVPSGAVVVAAGGTQIFTMNPATGYHVDSMFVDGLYGK